ncbi:ATP-binding protein [Rhodobacteraceae bacterium M382]|nr:ATP-binding protein [Rhodobacteraceae bacterium M382]
MSNFLETGNMVQPLRNVAALNQQILALRNRTFGLPGLGVFHGNTGYGKTFAATWAASRTGAIHVSVQKRWTARTLLEKILVELKMPQNGTLQKLTDRTIQGLRRADRALIIDEADYAVQRNLIDDIRDIQDGAAVPVIMIGMSEFALKLAKWPLVYNRVLKWTPAVPADLKDARILAGHYAGGVQVADDLLMHVLERNEGSVRETCRDLDTIREHALQIGVKTLTHRDWGNTPFESGLLLAPQGYQQ